MPNFVYSTDERVEMVRQHEQGISYRHIVKRFATEHPSRPVPAAATVGRIVKTFRKTGNLDPKGVKFCRPTRQISAEMMFEICLKAVEEPKKPTSEIAQELQLSKSSVRKVLRSAKLRSFRPNKHGEPSSPSDEQNQTTFSQNMMDTLKINESCLRRVCFSNESTILFVSQSNKQNVLLCSWRIQHRLINQSDIKYQKLHVWTGAVDNKPIGPFFLEGTLTGAKYLKLLREEIVPAVKSVEGDAPIIWYQRDGAPPYWTADVFAYLNEEFSGHWIGRNCQIQKQLLSVFDVSLLDHALLGRLKNILYAGATIENLSVLRTKVSEIIGSMDPQAVCSTIRAYYDRALRGGK